LSSSCDTIIVTKGEDSRGLGGGRVDGPISFEGLKKIGKMG